jgi:hypothetical protein
MKMGIEGQRGLGWFGMIILLFVIGFFALLIVKVTPLYINQMTITHDLHDIAGKFSTNTGEVDVPQVISSVQKRFATDYITQLIWADIKIVRGEHGLSMAYDYEARAELFNFGPIFGDVFIAIHFGEEIPIRTGGGG